MCAPARVRVPTRFCRAHLVVVLRGRWLHLCFRYRLLVVDRILGGPSKNPPGYWRPGARTPGDEQRDWAQERPATSKVTGRKDARRRAKRPGSRTPGDEQGVRTQGRPAKAARRRQAPGVSFFPQHPRGGYFFPRDENRGFSFSHLHDKGVIFPTYTTRGLFFPKANRRGVSGLQAPKSKVQTPKFVVDRLLLLIYIDI